MWMFPKFISNFPFCALSFTAPPLSLPPLATSHSEVKSRIDAVCFIKPVRTETTIRPWDICCSLGSVPPLRTDKKFHGDGE